MAKLDLPLIQLLFDKTRGRVKYKLGAKAPSLDADSNQIGQIDCSGWVRWVLHRAGETIPDGSQNQLAWARSNLRKLGKYADVQYAAKDPGRLFIAFLSPNPGNAWPRHVWLLRSNGKAMMTMESYSSGGVNSRAWNTKILMGCKECFEIPV